MYKHMDSSAMSGTMTPLIPIRNIFYRERKVCQLPAFQCILPLSTVSFTVANTAAQKGLESYYVQGVIRIYEEYWNLASNTQIQSLLPLLAAVLAVLSQYVFL